MSKKEQFPLPIVALEDVKTPEEFLQAVDFNVINDIFDTLVRKAEDGQPVSITGNRISPELVVFGIPTQPQDEKLTIDGSSNVSSGRISLIWGEHNTSVHPAYRVINTLATLIHEATHVRGGYKTEEWERVGVHDASWAMGYILRTGLRESRSETNHDAPDPRQEKIALSLNEAVTEDISHEVLHEYLVRTGNSTFLSDSNLARVLGDRQGYTLDRLVLATVIDALARELQVPRDEVWKGFVQAYMSGNTDVKQLLADIGRELEDDPNVAELVTFLASDQPLGEIGTLTEDSVIERIKIPDNAREVMDRVIDAFDAKKFKNALNLR